MKFYIKKIILWLDNGYKRELGEFENNKVNIITGDPSKGKSSILEILDYCFLASENTIVQGDDYIDRVEWFGINFHINDKTFTIARHSKKSDNYFFSSSGEIPDKPKANVREENIKNTIHFEFSIDDNVRFPFGGKEIRKNTKISHRYFMLFNTQTRDVLSNNKVLFDKQTDLKYQEALVRIIDIALGVTTIDNLIKKEKLTELENKKSLLESKIEFITKKQDSFSDEKTKLIEKAKKLSLISIELSSNDAMNELEKMLNNIKSIQAINNDSLIATLQKEKIKLNLKLLKYEKYKNQYTNYKKALGENLDSLAPIVYLKEKMLDVLQITELENIFKTLEDDFIEIKEYISKKDLPANIELEKEIEEIKSSLKTINRQISEIPDEELKLDNLKSEQLLFLGELKSSLKLYQTKIEDSDYSAEIKLIDKQINELKKDLVEVDRSFALDTLSEYMQVIFKEVNFSLRGYSEYKPIFAFKDKLIKLKKIDEVIEIEKTDSLIKNIGSSSNHLFLHLAFFTAIHRLFIKQNEPSKFIPQFLIFDQPDSPFYETNSINSEERDLFIKSLKILDNHIEYFKEVLKKDFQIIVLEHIEWKEIEKEKFKHYKLIEEWREGSGLIPPESLV